MKGKKMIKLSYGGKKARKNERIKQNNTRRKIKNVGKTQRKKERKKEYNEKNQL